MKQYGAAAAQGIATRKQPEAAAAAAATGRIGTAHPNAPATAACVHPVTGNHRTKTPVAAAAHAAATTIVPYAVHPHGAAKAVAAVLFAAVRHPKVAAALPEARLPGHHRAAAKAARRHQANAVPNGTINAIHEHSRLSNGISSANDYSNFFAQR